MVGSEKKQRPVWKVAMTRWDRVHLSAWLYFGRVGLLRFLTGETPNHQIGETYKSSTPFLPNHWSFFTRHLIRKNREEDTFCFIHFFGGTTWLRHPLATNHFGETCQKMPLCGSETFLNHINILFHVCSILTWYFGYILYMLHNIVVEFPTKPPRIKGSSLLRSPEKLIWLHAMGNQLKHPHIFVAGRYVWNFGIKTKKKLTPYGMAGNFSTPKMCWPTSVWTFSTAPGGTLGRSNLEGGRLGPLKFHIFKTLWSKQNPQDSKQETKIKNWLITWAWKQRCVYNYI